MAYAEPEEPKDLERLNPDLDTQEDRASRQQSAVALRIAGATYSEVAQALGYASANHARLAVERALASTVGDEDREQMRFLEGRRLERLLRGLWGKATNERHPEQLAATRTALAIIDRHAKLYGLDAPTQMVVHSPTAGEIEAWVAQMAAQVSTGMPKEKDIIEGEIVIEDDGYGDEEG